MTIAQESVEEYLDVPADSEQNFSVESGTAIRAHQL